MSPGPRGPYAVSKAFGRHWRRDVCQWKLDSDRLNRQYLSLIPLGLLLSAPSL
jgi:hypothetical protein